jgi:hypothetical protein
MKSTSLVVAALLVVSSALVAGCGGEAGSPKIKSFAASDTSLPEGGTDVTFTWSVKNAASLELLPFPGAVTGTSATVNVTEPTTFTLVAKKKGRSDRASLDITVGAAFDVTGTVVNSNGDRPAIGVTVAIGSRITSTDANGKFTFEDVVAPYDLVVVDQESFVFGGGVHVQVFLDVTRPDPTVNAESGFGGSGTARSGSIAGTATGGLGFPAADTDTYIVTALEGTDSDYYTVDAGTGAFNVSQNWRSEQTSIAAAINVVQYNYLTSDDFFHARLTGTLDDGTTLTLNPVLADVPENVYSALVTNTWGGDDYGNAYFGFNEFNEAYPTLLYAGNGTLSTAGILTLYTPQTSTSFSDITFGADDSLGYTQIHYLDPSTAGVIEVSVPEPVRILGPVDGATVGPKTRFSLATQPGMLNVLGFQPSLPVGKGQYYNAYVEVFTDKSSVQFPDLAAIGLPIPSGTYFQWGAYSVGPHADIDQALGYPGGQYSRPANVWSESAVYDGRYFVTEGAPLGDAASDLDHVAVPENPL